MIAEEVLDHSKLHTDDLMSQAQKESNMRFESLLMKIDQRFDEAKNRSKAVEKRTKTRLKAVEKRINKQLKALEVQVSDDNSTLSNIEEKLSDLRNRLCILPWIFALEVLGLLATLTTLFVNLQVIFG